MSEVRPLLVSVFLATTLAACSDSAAPSGETGEGQGGGSSSSAGAKGSGEGGGSSGEAGGGGPGAGGLSSSGGAGSLGGAGSAGDSSVGGVAGSSNVRDYDPELDLRVVVTASDLSPEGFAVMLADETGSHLATERADADGVALFRDVPDTTIVTAVIYQEGSSYSLETVFDVKPGTPLVVGWGVDAESVGSASFSYSFQEGLSFRAHMPASTASNSVTNSGTWSPSVRPYNLGGIDELSVVGYTSSGSTRVGYAVLQDVPFTGMSPSRLYSGALDQWKSDFVTLQQTLVNDTNAAIDYDVTIYAGLGVNLNEVSSRSLRPSAASQESHALLVPPDFYTWAVGRTWDRSTDGITSQVLMPFSSTGGSNQVVNLDMNASMSPPVLDRDTFDPQARSFDVGWTSTPSCDGNPPNLVYASLSESSDEVYFEWAFYGPYGKVLVAPELDPALQSELIPAGLSPDEAYRTVYTVGDLSYEEALLVRGEQDSARVGVSGHIECAVGDL